MSLESVESSPESSSESSPVEGVPIEDDGRECARLRVQPCGLFGTPGYELGLVQRKAAWLLERRSLGAPAHRIDVVALNPAEVSRQLRALRAAQVPVWPVSAQVLDGEYVELTVFGDNAQLTLGWWTVAPDGAGALSAFADWMRARAGFDDAPADGEDIVA